jgi:glycosyltransferase involved in cell wall biosynthesis
MGRISAFVLSYNEAEKIKAAIETLLWADEIVVVDSYSTDGTAQIAESLGARVVQVPFNGFGDLRNRAVAGAGAPRVGPHGVAVPQGSGCAVSDQRRLPFVGEP